MRDFDRMFLNLNDLENVPRYPGYSGYQPFATLQSYDREKISLMFELCAWIQY